MLPVRKSQENSRAKKGMPFFIKNKLSNLFSKDKAAILSAPAVDSARLRHDLADLSRGTSSMSINNPIRIVKKPTAPIPLPALTSSVEIKNRLKYIQRTRQIQRKRRGCNQRDIDEYGFHNMRHFRYLK